MEKSVKQNILENKSEYIKVLNDRFLAYKKLSDQEQKCLLDCLFGYADRRYGLILPIPLLSMICTDEEMIILSDALTSCYFTDGEAKDDEDHTHTYESTLLSIGIPYIEDVVFSDDETEIIDIIDTY